MLRDGEWELALSSPPQRLPRSWPRLPQRASKQLKRAQQRQHLQLLPLRRLLLPSRVQATKPHGTCHQHRRHGCSALPLLQACLLQPSRVHLGSRRRRSNQLLRWQLCRWLPQLPRSWCNRQLSVSSPTCRHHLLRHSLCRLCKALVAAAHHRCHHWQCLLAHSAGLTVARCRRRYSHTRRRNCTSLWRTSTEALLRARCCNHSRQKASMLLPASEGLAKVTATLGQRRPTRMRPMAHCGVALAAGLVELAAAAAAFRHRHLPRLHSIPLEIILFCVRSLRTGEWMRFPPPGWRRLYHGQLVLVRHSANPAVK